MRKWKAPTPLCTYLRTLAITEQWKIENLPLEIKIKKIDWIINLWFESSRISAMVFCDFKMCLLER